MVPTQIVMLIDAVVAAGDAPQLPDLRHVVYGGAPFAPADLKRALEVFGPVFVQLFGQGETPMTATYLPAADHAAALAATVPSAWRRRASPGPGWTCACSATTTASSRPATSARSACRARR